MYNNYYIDQGGNNLKKIPLVTVIVAIASLILFGFFLVNYNTYTNTLNEQFESQADVPILIFAYPM